jgi:hypothetical protein
MILVLCLVPGRTGAQMLHYKERQLEAALGVLDGADVYAALHPQPASDAEKLLALASPPSPFPAGSSQPQSQPAARSLASRLEQHLTAAHKPQPTSHKRPGAPPPVLSTPANKKSKTDLRATTDPPVDGFTEEFTGVRVSNRIVSSTELKERLQQAEFIPLQRIQAHLDRGAVAGDWTTAGVLSSSPDIRTASGSGKKFAMVKLHNMKNAVMTLFLFGDAFARATKFYPEGSLLFIGSPKVDMCHLGLPPLCVCVCVCDP